MPNRRRLIETAAIVRRRLPGGAAKGRRKRAGAAESDLTVVRVPGAFEIPALLRKVALSGDYDAAVALGCVGSVPQSATGDISCHRAASSAGAEALQALF